MSAESRCCRAPTCRPPTPSRGLCNQNKAELHFSTLFLIMDRMYEDVSDCEVDHSFFDSDFEEDAAKKGATTKTDEKGNSEHTQTEDTIIGKPGLNMETKMMEDNCTEEEDKANKDTESQEGGKLNNGACDSENALLSLASLNSEKASTSGRISAQGKGTHGKNISAQVDQIVKESEENYYTDEEDSSDDSKNQRVRLKLSKQSNSAKVSKNIAVSSSSSSSSSHCLSCSSDTDLSDSDGCLSDSSCSSSKKKSKCSLALLSLRQKPSPGIKSVEVKPKLGDYAEESEDTVTDVTPLSTPDISPIQSFELAASNDKKLKVKRQENVSQDLYEPDLDHKCHQKVLQEAVDLNHLLKAFLQLEKKEQQKLVLDQSSIGSRKNYSFTNEEVRQIDRENQRLLKELTKHSAKPRSKSASLKKPSGPTPKMYHSTINRQREQQRIDRENLAFLKRLEAVKPTAGMRRSEQLMDYQRQMSYLSSAPSPRRGKSALSHHSPSRGASGASSHSASSTVSRRSERPVYDSSSDALQRLKPTSIRTAWL
ncbi:cilia- and flagella-associated protein 97 isoform X1 [Zootoca vivipara]|uniref:cilia- and flagella-associated protein 97 isoform X1 n=2 Tax=Zootoca vivipara TaxID=8524 RepID=UPI00293B9746|nr:cilia- and flagella-associated protein 97 isoform X1 [Zootoca vivipara]